MAQHFTYSAPGRTEISGNHTDHQHGCVLAAAVNLETVADIELVAENTITIFSEGYPSFSIDLGDLLVHPDEKNTTIALVRVALLALLSEARHYTPFRRGRALPSFLAAA